jgi:hypothetical protein
MPLESAAYVGNLVGSNPVGASDLVSEGDNHIRLIKLALQATFPNATKPFRFPSGIAVQTGTVNLATTDAGKLVPVNCASGGITVNLPAIADAIYDGLEVVIVKSDYSTNLVTIDGASSDTINGLTTLVLRKPWQHARLRWNHTASAWFAQVDRIIPAGAKVAWGSGTVPDGWLFANGIHTIGDASSGADTAAVYTEQLFFHLYAAYSDTICPVSGGRGVSATADYAAHKRITMPDLRGRTIFGNPAMGGVTESTRLTDAVQGVDVSTPGIGIGLEEQSYSITVLQANLPDYELPFTLVTSNAITSLNGNATGSSGATKIVSGNSNQLTVSGTINLDGGGEAIEGDLLTTAPGFIDNWIMAL